MENFYKNFLRIQKKTLNINKMCWKGEIGHAKNQKKLEIKETLMKTAYEKIWGIKKLAAALQITSYYIVKNLQLE